MSFFYRHYLVGVFLELGPLGFVGIKIGIVSFLVIDAFD